MQKTVLIYIYIFFTTVGKWTVNCKWAAQYCNQSYQEWFGWVMVKLTCLMTKEMGLLLIVWPQPRHGIPLLGMIRWWLLEMFLAFFGPCLLLQLVCLWYMYIYLFLWYYCWSQSIVIPCEVLEQLEFLYCAWCGLQPSFLQGGSYNCDISQMSHFIKSFSIDETNFVRPQNGDKILES